MAAELGHSKSNKVLLVEKQESEKLFTFSA